jgi:hypothetical protein
MTYQLFYGDALAMANHDRHLDVRVCREQFSTEHEALTRARELVAEDAAVAVAIRDGGGNLLSGVRLQLKLGFCCE